MDLELSDDQFALRDGIRSLLQGRFDSARIRAGFDRAMYDELAAAGVFSLLADGFGWSDAVVVFEQLGEFCVPGPLVGTFLAQTAGLGDVVATVIDAPERGEPAVVDHLAVLGALLVLDGDAVRRVDPARLAGTTSDWPLDPLTPVTELAELPHGPSLDGEAAADWRDRGAVLSAAFAVGMAQWLTDASVAYAKERQQFDRPIGSFQAIKHLLADMAVRTETARAAVYAAGAQLGAPDLAGGARAVSVAKVMAGDAAVRNGKDATQVHGGMGFTWEVDVHLYLKRAWLLDTQFGSVDEHSDRLASLL
jgi:alkylation response protein AidB-like acyl-CoA dehydrogenase